MSELEPSLRVGEACAVIAYEGWRLAYIVRSDSEAIYEVELAGNRERYILNASETAYEIQEPSLRLAAKMLADSQWAPGQAYASQEHLQTAIKNKLKELEKGWK